MLFKQRGVIYKNNIVGTTTQALDGMHGEPIGSNCGRTSGHACGGDMILRWRSTVANWNSFQLLETIESLRYIILHSVFNPESHNLIWSYYFA